MSAGQAGERVHPPRRHERGTLFQRKDGLWIGKVRDPRSVRTGLRRMMSISSADPVAAAEKLDRLIDDLDGGVRLAYPTTCAACTPCDPASIARIRRTDGGGGLA